MTLINLPHGHTTLVDEGDLPAIQGLTLYLGKNGYVYFSQWIDGRSQPQTLHQFLMGRHEGMHTDHINGDKTDNQRSNLRVVTPQQNGANRHQLNKNNTSGLRGVQYLPHFSARNPWRAQIMVDGRGIHLGLFPDRESAILARRAAELEHFGVTP